MQKTLCSTTSYSLLLLLVLLPLLLSVASADEALSSFKDKDPAAQLHVDPSTGVFLDGYGRQRVFHGINIDNKGFPYVPDVTDELLGNWTKLFGFNAARLAVEWIGVEPVQGAYNQSFLTAMRGVGDRLGAAGIWYYLDMHQDTWGPALCGNGAPQWATKLTQDELQAFPSPITNTSCGVISGGGAVDCGSCPPIAWWGAKYFSFATSKAFQNFYDDIDGVQQAWINMWVQVVKAFQTSPMLFGYEAMNEPWMGNLYGDLRFLLEGGFSDKTNLQPMYEKLADAIRQVDPDHFFMYEPTTRDTQLLPFGDGFTNDGIGGPAWFNKTVYSWHDYCPFSAEPAKGLPQLVCDLYYDDVSFQVHNRDARNHGGGVFLSEFGAVGPDQRGLHEIDYVLNLADQYGTSWTYWDWHSVSGSPLDTEGLHLSRPYPQAVQGRIAGWKNSNETRAFDFDFHLDPSIKANTEVWTGIPLWYGGKQPKLTVLPADPSVKLSTSIDSTSSVLTISVDSYGSSATTTLVTVHMEP